MNNLPLPFWILISLLPPGDGSASMPFSSIQYAIDQSSTLSGNTLSIAPGTYFETLVLSGKALHLLGEQGPDNTRVDAIGSAPILRVEGAASAGSTVRGLSLLNGSALGFGGELQALDTDLLLVA